VQYVTQQISDFLVTNLTQEFPDWSSTTTYIFEPGSPTSASIVFYNNYFYRSLVGTNINFNPEEYLNIKWVKWEVSNTYAMIDLHSGTKSYKDAGNIDVTFSLVKGIDTIGIGYYEAETITVQILDSTDAILWEYTTESSVNSNVADWWTYIYTDYNYEVDRATIIKLPETLGTKVRVVFNKSSEATRTACGFLIAGEAISMGETLYGVKLSFNSFAVKEFDDFGTLTIVKRGIQDLIDFETSIDATEFATTRRKIKSIYNDIVLFILDESTDSQYENLLTLGVIESASEILSNNKVSTVSWSVFEAI
jgi:hypothetical protein